MKITKFAALAGVALLAGAGAFAQATDDYNLPQGFYFNNEIGSDVVKVTGNAHKDYEDTNWRSEFMGIYDDITLGYTSEKLAFEISPRFGIRDDQESYYNGGDYGNYYGHGNSFLYAQYDQNADANGVLNSDDMAFSYWGFDWDFRFSPFDIVDFYLNAGPDIVGSKLFGAVGLLGLPITCAIVSSLDQTGVIHIIKHENAPQPATPDEPTPPADLVEKT